MQPVAMNVQYEVCVVPPSALAMSDLPSNEKICVHILLTVKVSRIKTCPSLRRGSQVHVGKKMNEIQELDTWMRNEVCIQKRDIGVRCDGTWVWEVFDARRVVR